MADYELKLVLFISSPTQSIDEITNVLGVKPDRTVALGEVKRPGMRPSTANMWTLKSDLAGDNSEVVDQWRALIGRVPRKSMLADLAEGTYKRLSIVVKAHKYMPGVVIPPDVLKEVAELGLEVDMDIYCFQDHGEGDAKVG